MMQGGYVSNQGNDCDMETVPGEFDADDMIVMDGVTIDQTDDGTIDNHYMMAEPGMEDGETQHMDIHSQRDRQQVDVSADVEEMIRY